MSGGAAAAPQNIAGLPQRTLGLGRLADLAHPITHNALDALDLDLR